MSTFSQALCVLSLVIGVQLVASARVFAFEGARAYSDTSVENPALTNSAEQYSPPTTGAGSGSPSGSTGTGTR